TLRQDEPARQLARERSERLAVAAAEEQQVVSSLPLRLGAEVELVYAGEVGHEDGWWRFERFSCDPDSSLAVEGWVVDPADEIPRHITAIDRDTHPSRPLPRRLPGVVRSGVVYHRSGIERSCCSVEHDDALGP